MVDSRTDLPVNAARIDLTDTDRFTHSDTKGLFTLSIPRQHRRLVITHPDYKSRTALLTGPYWQRVVTFSLDIMEIEKYTQRQTDSLWCCVHNAIYWLPFELITGSLGVQYERILPKNHSIGLHTSFYLFGWGFSWNNKEDGSTINKFDGIKFNLFYRYYPWTRGSARFFLEGKLMAGYFDMHPLLYKSQEVTGWFSWRNVTRDSNVDFWAWGGGVAIGWAIRFSSREKGIFNVSIGLQAFPMPVKDQLVFKDQYGTPQFYYADKPWWYLGGPGSVLQIKVAYGGIF